MDEEYLYLRIAESIRREIDNARLKNGDLLPSIRTIAETWHCTNGTVQRAIRDLEDAGLVATHAGKRSRVIGGSQSAPEATLQRANLIHQAETFLLESMAAGYSPMEVDDALRAALNRWRSVTQSQSRRPANVLRYSGSHDLVVAWMATHFNDFVPGYLLNLNFTGSLSGLSSLQKNESDIVGAHLWEEQTGTFNLPIVQQMFPREKVALITLVHRRLGFITKPGNPKQIFTIEDLARQGIRMINRQPGSGTRMFLDAELHKKKIHPTSIEGYSAEKSTHSEIAAEVAQSHADTGIGLEASAKAFGLDFVLLTTERFDLILRESTYQLPPIERIIDWLRGNDFRILLNRLGGYESDESGMVTWTA